MACVSLHIPTHPQPATKDMAQSHHPQALPAKDQLFCPSVGSRVNGPAAAGCGVLAPGTYIIGPSLDLLVEFVLVLIPERRVAHQQDVQDDP